MDKKVKLIDEIKTLNLAKFEIEKLIDTKIDELGLLELKNKKCPNSYINLDNIKSINCAKCGSNIYNGKYVENLKIEGLENE